MVSLAASTRAYITAGMLARARSRKLPPRTAPARSTTAERPRLRYGRYVETGDLSAPEAGHRELLFAAAAPVRGLGPWFWPDDEAQASSRGKPVSSGPKA